MTYRFPASNTGKALLSATDAKTARDAILAVSDLDPRLDDNRVPVGGSVTSEKIDSTFLSTLVTKDGAQTLTGKTLTSPKVNNLYDTSGNIVLGLIGGVASPNYMTILTAASGSTPQINMSQSFDANVGLTLALKGTGKLTLYSDLGQTPTLAGSGAYAFHDLNLTSKGTGSTVQANGIPVVTTTGTQILSAKSISGSSNTLTNIAQSSVTSLVANLAAKADVVNSVDHQGLGAAGKPIIVSSSSMGAPGSVFVDPRMHNHLMYGHLRGATVTVLKNGSAYPAGDIAAINNMFLPDSTSAQFNNLIAGDVVTIEIDFTALTAVYGGTVFGFDARYYQTPGNVTIEAWDSVGLVWESVGSTAGCQGTYAKSLNSSTAKTKVRYTLSSFPQVTYMQVSKLYIAYVAGGPSDGYLPRGGGNLYGSNSTPPNLTATGADTNISLNLRSKGTGVVQANGVEVATKSYVDGLFIATATSVATSSGGVTTMDIGSAQTQYLTGSFAQTVKLPTVNIVAGQTYTIINQSTQSASVQSSAGNAISTVAAGSGTIFLALYTTPTSAAHWRAI